MLHLRYYEPPRYIYIYIHEYIHIPNHILCVFFHRLVFHCSVKEGIMLMTHEFSNWNKICSESNNFLNKNDPKENWYRLAQNKSHQQVAH